MMINEHDCEILLPSSIEDRYILPQGVLRAHASLAPFTGSVAIIQIVRLYAPLGQALKSSVVTYEVLQSFDEQFRSKMLLLPEAYQLGSSAALEAAALPPLFTLLSAQFHLYRCNLSPICRQSERSEALNRCVFIAENTAKYISRTLHNPPKSEADTSWQIRMAALASNMVCMHLWRCILVLCLRGDYDVALMCLHLSATIGDTRRINIACRKYLSFFLEQLLDCVKNGYGSSQQPECDEEMLAYASGDLQGSLEHSWAWAGTNLSCPESAEHAPLDGTRSQRPKKPLRDVLSLQTSPGLSWNGTKEWEGWGEVEQLIRCLMEEHHPHSPKPLPSYYLPPHNPVKRVQLASDVRPSPPKPLPNPSPAPSSRSRISIANII